MTRNIIKYVGLALVIVGIVIVMRNLFTSDTEWSSDKDSTTSNKNGYYSASISLLDKETDAFITGAKLVVKDESGNIINEWTSDSGVHLISQLKKGTYTLEEETAPDGYHLNSDGVSFEIKAKDEQVTMYNIAMTEEEKQYAASGNSEASSTTSSEVGVENTSSHKSPFTWMSAILSITAGIVLLMLKNKHYQNEI